MSDPRPLEGPAKPPASGEPATMLVILLHGLGADGNDLLGLAPYWAPHLPEAEFSSPHAPEACDMAPSGRQWFSLQSRDPDSIAAGAASVAPVLNDFIDYELARLNLTDRQLALVGFSQGTMMALYVGLRRPQPPAAIIGFSGSLIAPDQLASEVSARPPVLLIHGDRDEVVPVQALGFSGSLIAPDQLASEVSARPPVLLIHGDRDEVVPGTARSGCRIGIGGSWRDLACMRRHGPSDRSDGARYGHRIPRRTPVGIGLRPANERIGCNRLRRS